MSDSHEHLADLMKLYRRGSPMTGDGFDASNPLWNSIRILIVGAGGLGCELLHTLALSGFTDLEIIDMDTIELSNLNRQFLFREKDIGRPKADVAAEYVMRRCPHVSVKPHFSRIETKSNDFYTSFHMILLGLDSINARRWINAKVAELAEREVVDGVYRIVSAIPMIDGGTEGYQGSVKVIQLGTTACIECTMWMYPPTKAVPLCTLENVPRIPEHCVLFVKEKTWEQQRPGETLDADDPEHVTWVTVQAQERQKQFRIEGTIDYTFTLGVIKNVVPAVGFTNAIVAGCTALEALKMATGIAKNLKSYAYYGGGTDGIASHTNFLEPSEDCALCALAKVYETSFDVTPSQLLRRFVAALPLNEIWKYSSAEDSEEEEGVNADAAVKAYVDGPGTKPVYLKYSRSHPLRDADIVLQKYRSIREILVAKAPHVNLSQGVLFECTNNNIVASFFLKPEV